MLLISLIVRAAEFGELLDRPSRLHPKDGLGVPVPNPPPAPPPGMDAKMNTLLSWGKWGVLICGVAGLFICAGQMAIGRKNRSTFAADGATGIPWVLGGLSLAATAAPIVAVFFK
ncbi:hypothetical protein GCM10009527_095780 [Actinomadura nitritigenes]|uniref:DUF4134 domain-containing protein n=1 Tax=Actinomadura nitritigenes TaxID=134602 RepID=A0ABS3R2P6_9ACTN|nr:hypothetical protein [Actinomadura nitritigenes]MBO2440282.1 hypothetical protein [Actinomadura nitritigenes]